MSARGARIFLRQKPHKTCQVVARASEEAFMASGKERITGVAWYNEQEYEKLLLVAEDRAGLYDTYKEWKAGANNVIRQLRLEGLNIRRIDIVIDELVTWCKAKKRPVDGPARSEYVTELLRDVMRLDG
jgi:hypothetical protein